MIAEAPIHGRLDAEGRLVEADPRLAALQRSAGGEEGGPIAVPQIAALARLARRLGITISRSAVAAQDEHDLDLWVRAEPVDGGIDLNITRWSERPVRGPAPSSESERQSDFLRASANWTWESDASLRFTSLSPAAAVAAGKAPGQLIGTLLTSLFRLEWSDEGGLPILTALAEQSRFDGQLAELASGRGGTYSLSGIPLIDGHGRFAGFRGSAAEICHSVSPIEIAREQGPAIDPSAFGERLDKALRAPLAHIIANAETIGTQPEGPLRKDYAGYANDIASAGRHLLALVDDLVDLQAIERPDFKPEAEELDLADVARRAAGLMAVRAGAKQVRIDSPGADDVLPATGEFKRALQIVMNLLTNAIRYSPEGGMVWVRTDREGDLAALIVADQGKGVSAEDQQRIFEKFERVDPTEAGGTGLGLYIARRLARAMGGDIEVDSAPGKGARFTFTLPVGTLQGSKRNK
ncbi:sensor histidine kinase [Sphingosinicella rhizophila]|uniref:histidine kinase n=1 Tax=Sphingosinicella rhizophila TaxID=3050082 RepID=A0ABU3Q249_9SPHN|nr:HAMP domain-containing sensor histidine kinase [Sphingosinicella sp. GR2756]MDT9597498.1 HAMP domain-containing sensor histidine kinase [Sphingosinicella sp. GR2756]